MELSGKRIPNATMMCDGTKVKEAFLKEVLEEVSNSVKKMKREGLIFERGR